MYDFEQLKKTVDKFVVVLVGAPRGVTNLSWVRGVPEQLKRTIYNDDTEYKTWGLDKENWGCNADNKPEFHVCAVTNLYDSIDRYVQGEDHTLGGLSHNPYAMSGNIHYILDPMLRYYEESEYEHPFTYGKKMIDIEKWESYHKEHFDWCDSINFSYFDPFETMNNWLPLAKQNHIDELAPKGVYWAVQYYHMEQAYNENRELFDSLTPNSVVLRMRWDMRMNHNTTMWDFAQLMFQTHLGDQRNGNPQHTIHHMGWKMYPFSLVQGINIIRGHLSTADYWHCFDGTGAQLLGKRWSEWCWENPYERMPNLQLLDFDKDLNRKTNYWKYPEGVFMEFLYQNGYTIVDANTKGNLENVLLSFDTLLTDQYRYEFYGWTEEEVDYIRSL